METRVLCSAPPPSSLVGLEGIEDKGLGLRLELEGMGGFWWGGGGCLVLSCLVVSCLVLPRLVSCFLALPYLLFCRAVACFDVSPLALSGIVFSV